jgi:acyl carrier protein
MDDARISAMPEIKVRSSDEIEHWLVTRFAEVLNVEPERIDAAGPITDYQIDSSAAVTVTNDFSEWLGISLPVTLFWEYPTMRSLAAELAAVRPSEIAHPDAGGGNAACN